MMGWAMGATHCACRSPATPAKPVPRTDLAFGPGNLPTAIIRKISLEPYRNEHAGSFRHTVPGCIDRHRPVRSAPGEDLRRLRQCRALAAALCRDCHRVRDLVRFGDRAGHPGQVRQGRLGRRDRGPVRRVDVPGAGGLVLRQEAVPDEPADHRRLLPAALQPQRRDHCVAVHRGVLPRLGVGTDHRAGAGVQRVVQGRHQHVGRHVHRRRHRAGLHAVRRHVVGGADRSFPDEHHRRRPAVHRLPDLRHGRRRAERGRPCRCSRQVRLCAGARPGDYRRSPPGLSP